MNGFAQLIASRRTELGLDRSEVAEAIGRSAAVLEAWENDRTFPEDPLIIDGLASVLRLPRPLLAEAFNQSAPHAARAEVGDLGGASAVVVDGTPPPEPGSKPETTHLEPFLPEVVEPQPDSAGVDVVESVEAEPEDQVPLFEPEVAAEVTAELEDVPPTESADQQPAPPPPIEAHPDPVGEQPAAPEPSPAPRPAYQPPVVAREPVAVATRPPELEGEPDLVERALAILAAPFQGFSRRFRRNRWTSRAPTQQPSYIEDRKQWTTYQLRAIFTAAAVIILLLALRWAWGRFAEAWSVLWESLVSAI